MALRRLLDQDAQRERRRQMILLDRLSASAERLMAREITSTTRDMVKAWETSGNVPQPLEHERRVNALLNRIWRASVEGMAKRINEAAKSKGKPSVTKQEAKWDLFVQEYIAAYGGEKIVSISETTRTQIMTQIFLGQKEGLGQRDIAKKITANATIIGRQRANVIARTETHAAGNYGAKKQAEDTGLQMQREWIASQGARTRETHSSADGQIVGMNDPFDVGGYQLMFPGDPAGPAAEVINCRCAIGYVVAD